MKVRDLRKLIERWLADVRTTGSHHHFRHPTMPGTVTIPGPPSDDVAIGTHVSILKQAGLKG